MEKLSFPLTPAQVRAAVDINGYIDVIVWFPIEDIRGKKVHQFADMCCRAVLTPRFSEWPTDIQVTPAVKANGRGGIRFRANLGRYLEFTRNQ